MAAGELKVASVWARSSRGALHSPIDMVARPVYLVVAGIRIDR